MIKIIIAIVLAGIILSLLPWIVAVGMVILVAIANAFTKKKEEQQ